MIKFTIPDITWPSTKTVVAWIVIGGYVLALGTLAFVRVPDQQLDTLDKALVGLGTLAGAIVNSLFQRRETT